MKYTNRLEAGQLLAERLKKYRSENDYVYALPRGGVVVASPIAENLHAPLGLIFVRKIGSPWDKEVAVAAVSESGEVVGGGEYLSRVPDAWFKERVEEQLSEIKRQRYEYLGDAYSPICDRGLAIIVDDGVATGLTLQAAIAEVTKFNPRRIIVAVPIITKSVYDDIMRKVDRIIALEVCSDDEFKGSISNYYQDFSQVSDEEVITILRNHEEEQVVDDIKDVLRNIARY